MTKQDRFYKVINLKLTYLWHLQIMANDIEYLLYLESYHHNLRYSFSNNYGKYTNLHK